MNTGASPARLTGLGVQRRPERRQRDLICSDDADPAWLPQKPRPSTQFPVGGARAKTSTCVTGSEAQPAPRLDTGHKSPSRHFKWGPAGNIQGAQGLRSPWACSLAWALPSSPASSCSAPAALLVSVLSNFHSFSPGRKFKCYPWFFQVLRSRGFLISLS